ncbi:MAG TPA: gamma-glutamylcyclotransferase [Vineibacter sp.]|nr:gamma-glutamylcyclotransferase [Vineibacter sp.]
MAVDVDQAGQHQHAAPVQRLLARRRGRRRTSRGDVRDASVGDADVDVAAIDVTPRGFVPGDSPRYVTDGGWLRYHRIHFPEGGVERRACAASDPRVKPGRSDGRRPRVVLRLRFEHGSDTPEERCTDKGVPILERIAGHLPGWRLAFNKKRRDHPGEGVANVMEDASGLVEGTLNRMALAGLNLLDVDEGVGTGQYQRRNVQVTRVDSGAAVDAVMYVALPAVVATGLRPPRWYLNHLLAGGELLSRQYHATLSATPVVDQTTG